MYLLKVLSADKTSEITSIMNLNQQYASLSTSLPPDLQGLLTRTTLEHHTRRFDNPTYAGLINSLTAEEASDTKAELVSGGAGVGAAGSGSGGAMPGGGGLLGRVASRTLDSTEGRARTNTDASGHSRTTTSASTISQYSPQTSTPNHSHSHSHSHSQSLSQYLNHSRDHTREYSATSSRGSDDIAADRPPLRVDRRDRRDGSDSIPKSVDRPDRDREKTGGVASEEVTTLRSQVSRFLPPPPTSPPSRQAFLSTLMEVFGESFVFSIAIWSPCRAGQDMLAEVVVMTCFDIADTSRNREILQLPIIQRQRQGYSPDQLRIRR